MITWPTFIKAALIAAFLFALIACLSSVWAADAACVDSAGPRKMVESRHGRWIGLTQDQWEFMRGVYALNPNTPAGLPVGDHAVLATMPSGDGGMILFMDGNKACSTMPIPHQLTDMLMDVGSGVVIHEGEGM